MGGEVVDDPVPVMPSSHHTVCDEDKDKCPFSKGGVGSVQKLSNIDAYTLYKDLSGNFSNYGFFFKSDMTSFVTEVLNHI